MDEIKQRLTEASEACIKTYEAWRAKTGDHATREALQEAVHELRKVGARLEIELAVSDRKAQGADPIPIPSHRASRRPAQGADMEAMEDDSRNNRQPSGNFGGNQGGGNQGGGRRPVHIRRPSEGAAPAAAAPASSEAAPADAAGGDDDGQKRTKPLSLRRGGNDADQA